MKNIKTIIALSVSAFLFSLFFIGVASASNSSIYVSPANLSKNIGDIFNISIGVNASGNKVCAIEGTLVFNNLSCQNINVVNGLVSQSSPSCLSPYFLIGVPNCTTADKTIFNVSVKAENAGIATIGLNGVDIVGEGMSLGSSATGGSYTFVATQESATISSPKIENTPSSNLNSNSPSKQKTTSNKNKQNQIATSTGNLTIKGPNFFLATISAFITLGTGSNIIGIIVLIAIIFAVFLYYFYFFKKRK